MCAKLLQSRPTLWDPMDCSPPSPLCMRFPGKNTGVGCHFLLQLSITEELKYILSLICGLLRCQFHSPNYYLRWFVFLMPEISYQFTEQSEFGKV